MFFGLFIIPIVIVGLIIFFIWQRVRTRPSQYENRHLQLALSKEDAVSQLFLLLSVLFLGVTLLGFNKDFGSPLSWRAILFITSAIGLISAYYFKTVYVLIFSLVGVTVWWSAQAAEWASGKDIKISAVFAGGAFIALLFYVLGHLHEKETRYRRFALVYLVLGIISVTGLLFFLSTKPGILALEKATEGNLFFSSWQIAFSLFLFAVIFIGILTYAASKKLISVFEILAAALLAALFGVIAFLPEQDLFAKLNIINGMDMNGGFVGFSEPLSGSGVLWAVIFNVIVFFELLGLIFSGYSRRETWLINLGALFLFILIIVKYFDWFFTFLDKSIFFIGAGILLFAVGWFMERGRRYMISNIESGAQKPL